MEVIYICGDYNIDLLKMSSNNDYCLFYENVLSSSFAPKITLPTRICETTSILIDNILYKRLQKELTDDPNTNYKILSKILEIAKNRHIPKKIKRFNKRKHQKEC